MSTPRQPNILFVFSDQHRWSSLNCYGNPQVITPAFDRMAAEGVRFTHAISNCPVCAPARTTVQTGLHAHQHRIQQNNNPWVGQHFRSVADHFNDAGYETCFIGKAHWGRYMFYDMKWKGGFVPPSRRLRWKHWFSTEGHRQYDSTVWDDHANPLYEANGTPEATFHNNLAFDFIEQCGDKPWLTYIHWGAPHNLQPGNTVQYTPEYYTRGREINRQLGLNLPDEMFANEDPHLQLLMPQHLLFDIVPQRFLDLYNVDDITVDPNVPAEYRTVAAYHYREYYALITHLDEEMARIFEFLHRTGRDRDTLVVYTSDHGDRIAAHCTPQKFRTKSSPHQNSFRIPMIAWNPHLGVGQGRVNRTPFSLVDIVPTLLDCAGIKVDPHLPGESLKDCFMRACAERRRNVLLSLRGWRAVTDGRYLYAIEDAQTTWKPMHLFDMDEDPWDLNNLLDDPQHQSTRQRLHDTLVEELIRTSDHEFVLRTGLKQRELF